MKLGWLVAGFLLALVGIANVQPDAGHLHSHFSTGNVNDFSHPSSGGVGSQSIGSSEIEDNAGGLTVMEVPIVKGRVYCLHGFMRTSRSMRKMALQLQKEGWRAVQWSYCGRTASISDLAEQLVQELCRAASEEPGKPISFVTHSLGGLVLRSALNHPNCPYEARCGQAVLLACPNGGSHFGRRVGHMPFLKHFLAKGAGAELLTADHFAHLGPFPRSMEVLVIAGQYDAKVRPRETALSTPHWSMVVPYTHAFLASRRRVITAACDFLGKRHTRPTV